ncbi:OmpA/MotB family protein [Bacillus pinisoli]|uniref:OmpA/MotB family protein n=1 Tax=Bacillus pinisoli TaxID=2901866 RepID=UPI001FF3E70E|nr:OmpA family protein [Bacillus pinisoli]
MSRQRARIQEEENLDYYWPSFTDMMAMVVLVILFIAIIAFVQAIYTAYDQAEIKQELEQTANIKKQISDLIEQRLEENVGKDKVTRGPNNTISIEGDILFDTGSSEVSEEGKKVLASLSDGIMTILNDPELKPYLYIILIEGHTDSVPFDNWTLSTDRAVSVVKNLLEANPKLATKEYAQYLAATGYSEFKPIVEGNSPEDLRKNRRISFQIILDDQKWQESLNAVLQNQ